MNIFSLAKLAEEAGYIAEGNRNLLGAIQNARTFEKNFGAFDQAHHGVFAFMAFHPVADKQIAEYIAEGTLGDDAGKRILALFLAGDNAPRMPRPLEPKDLKFGVQLSVETHPAYDLAARFFPKPAQPEFPGLVIFDRLSSPKNAIYIPLSATDKAQVRASCRKIFSAANDSFAKKGTKQLDASVFDFDRLAALLVDAGVPYRRTGKRGIRSAAFVTGAWIKKNAGLIVTALPKLIELAVKATS